MRVKLSYTVDIEDVLKEAAKLLNLQAEDLNQAINLFTAIQKELRAEEDPDGVPNTSKALEMVEEFRSALLNVDTRLEEVCQIVQGYEDYDRSQRETPARDLQEEGEGSIDVID
jgi:hypothetical protein